MDGFFICFDRIRINGHLYDINISATSNSQFRCDDLGRAYFRGDVYHRCSLLCTHIFFHLLFMLRSSLTVVFLFTIHLGVCLCMVSFRISSCIRVGISLNCLLKIYIDNGHGNVIISTRVPINMSVTLMVDVLSTRVPIIYFPWISNLLLASNFD